MKKILLLLFFATNLSAQYRFDTTNVSLAYNQVVCRGDTILLSGSTITRTILRNFFENPRSFDVDCYSSDSSCILTKDINLGNGVIAEIVISHKDKNPNGTSWPVYSTLHVFFKPVTNEGWAGDSYSDEIYWRVVDALLKHRDKTIYEAQRDRSTLLELLSNKLR